MKLPRAFGPYTLLRRIAVGGMAEVYVAKTHGLGGFEKHVALKLVHPHLSVDEHFVRMLIDEAKVLVQLNHANIAQVLDLGRIGDDYYISMEYVDGWNLHQIVSAARSLERPLAPEMAAHIIAETCAGLDHAHRKRDLDGRPLNLVHRDVSPQNILVSQSGEVKLVDFGIAKGRHRGEGTEVGVIKGKYNYMSPEQAWADPMDRRSDLFSAGIVLWEILVGRMLHQESNVPKLIANVRNAVVPPLRELRPDVPEALAAIIARATAREQGDRFPSAADMSEALRDFVYEHAPAYNARTLGVEVDALMAAHAEAKAEGRIDVEEPPEAKSTREELPDENLEAVSVVTREDWAGTEGRAVVTREDWPAPPPGASSGPPPVALPSSSIPSLTPPASRKPPSVPPPPPPSAPTNGSGVPSQRPSRRLPPLPFDSIAPPTERMDAPPVPVQSTWPKPHPAFGEPVGAGPSWDPREPTRVDMPFGASPSHAPMQGASPLDPQFDEETTSRYEPSHLSLGLPAGMLAAPGVPAFASSGAPPDSPEASESGPAPGANPPRGTSRAKFASRDALRPPASGIEPLPPVPPIPALPDVDGAGQLFRGASGRRGLLGGIAVGLAALFLALVAYRLWGQKPPAAGLEILSEPSEANVYVNGELRPQRTPSHLGGFEPGRDYELRVEKEGYVPWEGTYHAAPGVVQHIAVLRPAKAELYIATEPKGATLRIDGVQIGVSPLRVSALQPGRRILVEASLEGHQSVVQPFTIQADELRPRLDLKLTEGE